MPATRRLVTVALVALAAAANACVVVVVWSPADTTPPRRAQDPPSRLGAFDHWLDFTPELTTSPTYRDALVAQLPTWVWDRNTADVRGICLPIYGGVCGFAVRLGTVVWRLPWYIPIVFPLEVCHTDQVGVQEAQILSGQPPR